MINLQTDVQGYYSLKVMRPDGTVRATAVAPEFPNLITNSGLDAMGDRSDYLQYCVVGASSTTPSVTDTALGAFIASTQTRQSTDSGCTGEAPYYIYRINTYRFSEGTAAGNLSEVGVGWSSTGNNIFSRALILDEFGDPTTLTVLSDETLDVTYQLRYYPKVTDDTGTVVLTGNIGGTHDFIMRASNVTSNAGPDWIIGTGGTSAAQSLYSHWVLYTGDIGAITSTPSGSIGSPGISSVSSQSYVPGSYERLFNLVVPLNIGNNALGIRSIKAKMGIGAYQVQFDPPIMKTSNDILTLVFKHSWARRPEGV